MDLNKLFARMAGAVAHATGTPVAFLLCVLIIVVWGVTGPLFHFSDTWQLVINTGTTIVTFLMVFLIQNAQNRDTQAIQLKLDELIRATRGAQNSLMALEEQGEDELAAAREDMKRLAEAGAEKAEQRSGWRTQSGSHRPLTGGA